MRINLLELRPTQMALGMKEVELRLRRLLRMKEKEREPYLKKHRVPVVLGPEGRVYLVDHHHLIRACWEAGRLKVPVEVRADFRRARYPEFWRRLRERHWIHLFDQFGNGPHDPVQLPESIKCLADDPFRSLSWLVRESGGYQKTDVPFAEFLWAGYFRRRMNLHPGFHGLKRSLPEALKLARGRAASRLPGFGH